MGCDIHAIIERKGNWYSWINSGNPEIHRNYELFAVLADVRNAKNVPYICKPRGLPKDVCREMECLSDSFGTYGHSHSFVTLKELEEFDLDQKYTVMGKVGKCKIFGVFRRENFNDLIFKMTKVKNDYGLTSEEVRLVFFFDN
ncbi:MAG: hypothetical protein ACTSYH_03695 [Candidatus Heimdallarchaeaceae archaeon]